MILTSDKPPVELKDIEQRLLTRFKWGLSTQLNTPDYDTKVKIIRIKAQKLGLQLTDEIVRYLADNISANVREIEGALSALVANTVYMGKKVSLSLVKEILKVYVRVCQKRSQSSTSSKSSATSCISTSSASIRPNEPAKWLRRVRSPCTWPSSTPNPR